MSTYRFKINQDGRVNLTLSKASYNILENDMEKYTSNRDSKYLSSFLNVVFEKVISNFFVDKLIYENNKLRQSVEGYLNSSIDPLEFEKAFEKATIKIIEKELKSYQISKKDRIPVSVKLNLKNVNTLKEYENAYIFENKPLSFFVRCLFESYTRLSVLNRERIFFSDLIKEIEMLSRSNGVIKYMYRSGKYELFVPYQIREYENSQTYFVIGYLPVVKKTRIQQLKNLNKDFKIEKEPYYLSPEEIDQIESDYNYGYHENTKSSTAPGEYTVEFDEYGIKQFDNQSFGRPKTKSPTAARRKVFTSTDEKMLSYFLKFGPNIEIIEPAKARHLFKTIFEMSLEKYKKD